MNFRDTTELEKLIARSQCEGCEPMVRKAYEAGLRRAQELAKEHCYADYYNHDPSEYLVVDFVDFDASIDAEVAKEGK